MRFNETFWSRTTFNLANNYPFRNAASTNGADSTASEGVKRKLSSGAIDSESGPLTPVKSKIVVSPKTPVAPITSLSDDIITRKKVRLFDGTDEVGAHRDTASIHSSASSSGSDKKSVGTRRKLFPSVTKEGDS